MRALVLRVSQSVDAEKKQWKAQQVTQKLLLEKAPPHKK